MKYYLDLLIKYWTQLLVFVGVVGFLISRLYKNHDDRAFKRFELFQEKRLEASVGFYTRASEFYKLAIDFPIRAESDSWMDYLKELKSQQNVMGYEMNKMGFYFSKKEMEVFSHFIVQAFNFHFLIEKDHTAMLNEILIDGHLNPMINRYGKAMDVLSKSLRNIANQEQDYYYTKRQSSFFKLFKRKNRSDIYPFPD